MPDMQPLEPIPDDRFAGSCVLLVEDDEIMRLSLEDRFRLENIPVQTACSLAEAVHQLERRDVDLVVTDIRLPDGSGGDLFEKISLHYPGIPVILMTAFGDVSQAVGLVKAGAVDYLTKPFDLQTFIGTIRRTLSRMADARLTLPHDGTDSGTFRPGTGVLGKSPAMRRIERVIARLCDVDSSVLITGESGVGKEVVANLIHRNSRRAEGPFVTVNCAALPPSLVESELFGHEKGSFTGATQRRIGRFEKADRGTIFLDEIAEIAPDIQVKLLRVLQERIVERVGGGGPVPIDVRVIAATQVDLDQAVMSGRFRSDLFWRLNVIHVHIPPLRERKEDVLYLSRLFLERQAGDMGIPIKHLSGEAEEYLLSMPFPGNVRELKNILERAMVLSTGPQIMTHDLGPLTELPAEDRQESTLRESVEKAERRTILDALERHEWAVTAAARALDISRKNLWEKMKRYRISKDAV